MNEVFQKFTVLRSASFAPTLKDREIKIFDVLALIGMITPIYLFSAAIFNVSEEGAALKAIGELVVTVSAIVFFIASAVLVSLYYASRSAENAVAKIFLSMMSMYLIALLLFSINLFIFPPRIHMSYVGVQISSKLVVSLFYCAPGMIFVLLNTNRIINKRIGQVTNTMSKKADRVEIYNLKWLYWTEATVLAALSLLLVAYIFWQTVFYRQFDDQSDPAGWNRVLVTVVSSVFGGVDLPIGPDAGATPIPTDPTIPVPPAGQGTVPGGTAPVDPGLAVDVPSGEK